MGMFKSGAKQGYAWMRDCLAIYRQNPAMWMLVALAYVLMFVVIPALQPLPTAVKLVVVALGPIFLALVLSLFREADLGTDNEFSDIVRDIKPQMGRLAALGGVCLVYGIIASMLTSHDMQAVNEMAQAKADPEAMAGKLIPLLIKLLLLLTPIFMATWFAPMLIAHHRFTVFKAIKSSIAGCLSAVLPLTVAWLLLTIGLTLVMMLAGTLAGIITMIAAPIGTILTSLMLLAFLLLATALMLALQYVSYRDVFARKMRSEAPVAPQSF